jgi:tetratricopeptide (TPR) repeat protein
MLIAHRSIVPPPAVPQTFVGRDAELAQIIGMISGNIRSHPARIAILGPGGFGKTTLANAVLTHDEILKHYGDARYFIPCESVSSSGALLIELGRVLGHGRHGGQANTLWPHIYAALCSKEAILCFDNFESIWDQSEDVKQSAEELLSRITELCSVTVLITMRGTERPAKTKWTQPFLEPLKTLDHDAAKKVWEQIAGYYDIFSEKLLEAVENVPLAVDLLAHLAQGQRALSKLLWDEWNMKYIQFIKRGHMNRLSDLEFSIQLSIDSERMRANPSAKALLGVLSMLSDGMHIDHVSIFATILSDIDVMLCLRVLQKCSLIRLKEDRYQVHSIVCQFCINQGLMSAQHRAFLEQHYMTLASYDGQKASSQIYAQMALEVHNTKFILLGILSSKYSEQSKLINATVTFSQFCASIGDFDTTLLNQAIQFIECNGGATSLSIRCFQVWGELYYYAADMNNAMDKLQKAENLCLTYNSDYGQYGSILALLGQIYLSQHKLDKAADSFKKALHLYQTVNNISGQGDIYERLGMINVLQDNLKDAKASFQEAYNCYKASDSKLGQGNVYLGLGEIYLNQNKLKEAKDQFQRALKLHKAANNHLSQGYDYKGLGDIYLRQNKLSEAEESFQKALELHKAVNAIVDQGNDHRGLGDVYLQQKKLNKAETSYKSALELYKNANNVPSQGNALNRLGHVYLMKSQLREAKDMFEKALKIHKQIQAKGWEQEDKEYLDQISSQLAKGVRRR